MVVFCLKINLSADSREAPIFKLTRYCCHDDDDDDDDDDYDDDDDDDDDDDVDDDDDDHGDFCGHRLLVFFPLVVDVDFEKFTLEDYPGHVPSLLLLILGCH